MTYDIEFDKRALKEWGKLDSEVKKQFKNKLSKVLMDRNLWTGISMDRNLGFSLPFGLPYAVLSVL
ncbi:hypothetical protein L4C31_00330 [Aliivibrio sifiae]